MIALEYVNNTAFFAEAFIPKRETIDFETVKIRREFKNLKPCPPAGANFYQGSLPYHRPVIFAYLLRKRKKLTPRECLILKEKARLAKELNVHPDLIFIYTGYESY